MGAFTLEQFRSGLTLLPEIRSRTDISNEELDDWINLAYIECATALDLVYFQGCKTFPTINGINYYNLPDGQMGIGVVADLTSKRVLIRSGNTSFALRDDETTGEPKYWAQRGNGFIVWPTPDGVYNIRVDFYNDVETMVEEDSKTVIPAMWDPAIRFLAQSYALADLGFSEKSAERFTRYMSYMRSRSDTDLYGGPTEGFNVARSYEDLTTMREF